MFFITMDQVLDNKWKIESNLLNDPNDEIYVLRNIITDNEDIGYMSRDTEMQAGRYCFVSPKKVIKYLSNKLTMSGEGRLVLND